MSNPITEEELARKEARTNKAWQEAIDQYRKEYPASELECILLTELAKMVGLHCAGQIFSAAMMKLHVAIGYQTGQMMTGEDIMEGGIDGP